MQDHPTDHKTLPPHTSRLIWLDGARGAGIFLVVLGHLLHSTNPVKIAVYSFHVPLFFMISGILTAYTKQEYRNMKAILRSRIRSLLVPYILYEVIFVLLYGVLNHFDFTAQNNQAWDGLFLNPVNTPVWYLVTAFFAEIILILLLQKIEKKWMTAVICLVLFIIPFFVTARGFWDPLLRICSSIGFLAAGYFLAPVFMTLVPPLPVSVLLFAGCMALSQLNGLCGIYKLDFGLPLLFTLCALTASASVIWIFRKLPARMCKIAAIAGTNTIAVLGLHYIPLRVLETILPFNTETVPGICLMLLFLTICFIPVCFIINRFFPWAAGRKKQAAT